MTRGERNTSSGPGKTCQLNGFNDSHFWWSRAPSVRVQSGGDIFHREPSGEQE